MAIGKVKILVQNIKWIYLSKIAVKILALVSTVLVIRKLDVDVFGTYSLLTSSFFLFSVLSLSAIDQLILRYIPEFIVNREYRKMKKFIRYGVLFSGFVFCILFFLLYLNKKHFANIFNIENFDSYFMAFAFFCISLYFKNIIGITLQALLLHKKYAIVTITNSAVRTSLYIALLEKLDVNLLLYIEMLLATIFIIPGTFIYFQYISNLDASQSPNKTTPITIRRIIRYGLFSMGNVLGKGIVGRQSDHFIVAALSNPYSLGIFAFANRLYAMVYNILPFQDFYSVVRPLFFQRFSGDYKIEDFQKMCAFMVKALIPVYLFPFLYILFFGQHIIDIVFDPKYKDAYFLILILLSPKPFVAFFNTVGLTAHLKERVDYEMYTKIVIIFSIFGAIYGIKLFGLVGVVIATTLGTVFQNILLWILMRKYPEVKFRIQDYSKYLLVVISTLPFLTLHFIDLNWFLLIFLTLIFVVYYILAIIVFHPFTKYDLSLMDKIALNSSALMRLKSFIGILVLATDKFMRVFNTAARKS